MADRISSDERSWMMSRVRGKDTTPERIVRSLLHKMGYRFRLHRNDLPGKPDIILPKYESVTFVNGCFWHQHEGCKRASRPNTNTAFWNAKFEATVNRDKKNIRELKNLGWRVLVVWECQLREMPKLQSILRAFLTPA